MNYYSLSEQNQKKPAVTKASLRAASLTNLSEALFKEEYEACAGFIQDARYFGASKDEVKEVLENCVSGKARGTGNVTRKSSRF